VVGRGWDKWWYSGETAGETTWTPRWGLDLRELERDSVLAHAGEPVDEDKRAGHRESWLRLELVELGRTRSGVGA